MRAPEGAKEKDNARKDLTPLPGLLPVASAGQGFAMLTPGYLSFAAPRLQPLIPVRPHLSEYRAAFLA